MKQYDPATHVAVPKSELAKLEQSRVDLYSFLSQNLSEWDMNIFIYHSQQIWNVANRIKWED